MIRLIERELFDKVQQSLTSNKRNRVKNKLRCYPLSSLLKIAGQPTSLFRGSSGTGRSKKVFYYYRCEQFKICIPCEDLEKKALDILVAIAFICPILYRPYLLTMPDCLVASFLHAALEVYPLAVFIFFQSLYSVWYIVNHNTYHILPTMLGFSAFFISSAFYLKKYFRS